MKYIFILLLSLYFPISAFAQKPPTDSGFTNISEATNHKPNGIKEGKWVEYTDEQGTPTRKEDAFCYKLIIYKEGKPSGVARSYYNNGSLETETTFLNGKKNGVYTFYSSGRVVHQIPYVKGKIVGIAKYYYPNGKLSAEVPYSKFGKKSGIAKEYTEEGAIKKQTRYRRGNVKKEIFYDTKGLAINNPKGKI